jgi:class 3 adenylate cyclase
VGETPRGDAALEGERRQLMVLFCDLVGSTELSGSLDPEDYRLLVRGYQARADEAIRCFGGHVAQHLGDGLLAYFGWPQAFDDAAERAVRAGLALVEARGADAALQVRVGIHTGPVEVSELGSAGRSEMLALGETPNLAARVQALAAPGTVMMTAATHRLASGMFVVEDAGLHALKGVREPVHVYRAVAASGVRSRFAATAARGLTPFVGREHERQLCCSRVSSRRRRATARSCCSRASPASGSRACCSSCARISRTRTTPGSSAWPRPSSRARPSTPRRSSSAATSPSCPSCLRPNASRPSSAASERRG